METSEVAQRPKVKVKVIGLVAIPGFGKSTLLSALIERLQKMQCDYRLIDKDALMVMHIVKAEGQSEQGEQHEEGGKPEQGEQPEGRRQSQHGGKSKHSRSHEKGEKLQEGKSGQIVTLQRVDGENNVFTLVPRTETEQFSKLRVRRKFSPPENKWVFTILNNDKDDHNEYSLRRLNSHEIQLELQNNLKSVAIEGKSDTRYVILDQNMIANNMISRIHAVQAAQKELNERSEPVRLSVCVCVPKDEHAAQGGFFSDPNLKMCVQRVQERDHHPDAGPTGNNPETKQEQDHIEQFVTDFNGYNSYAEFKKNLKTEGDDSRQIIASWCKKTSKRCRLDIKMISLEEYQNEKDIEKMVRTILRLRGVAV